MADEAEFANHGTRAERKQVDSLRILAAMLQAGLQEYDWVIGGIVTRAKSTLAASAIVLGVLIAGLGGFAWILNSSGAADMVINYLRSSQMLFPVALFGVGGFVSMLWAAYYSVSALSVVEIKSPFSSSLIMSGDAVDEKGLQKIAKAREMVMCENMCKSYAYAIKNRERVIKKMGPKALKGQKLLGIGLTSTAIASIITIMVVITSGGTAATG